MGLLKKSWVLLPLLPLLSGSWFVGRSETLRSAAQARHVLHLRILSVPNRWREYRAVVVDALKGDARVGDEVRLDTCDDLDWAVGEEILVITDRVPVVPLCGQDGGWPTVRRITGGRVRWDGWDDPRVPLRLFRWFVPQRIHPRERPPEKGG